MELAIPLVALGGMYVMSNQDKEGEIEAAKQSQTVQGTPVKAENFEKGEIGVTTIDSISL